MVTECDVYFGGLERWKAELVCLRAIVCSFPLEEALKWRTPCYVFEGANVLMLGAQKSGAVLSFFKGALLADPDGLLERPGANSQAGRLVRFDSEEAIVTREAHIREFIAGAIEVERRGQTVERQPEPERVWAVEWEERLESDSDLREAFGRLTPGRQRAYWLNLSGAKQPATRIARIEKFRDRILEGKGPNDCVCGLSKRMPGCDGSHKKLGT